MEGLVGDRGSAAGGYALTGAVCPLWGKRSKKSRLWIFFLPGAPGLWVRGTGVNEAGNLPARPSPEQVDGGSIPPALCPMRAFLQVG